MAAESAVLVRGEQGEISALPMVQEFQSTLSHAEATVVDVPLFLEGDTPVPDAVRAFLQTERRAGSNLYLHPAYSEFTQAGAPAFALRKSRGGTRSAHGVFFGDLLFEDGSTLPVAVKPHQDDPNQSCATDYLANVAVRQAGMETLEPVGMVFGASGQAYSMTRLEPLLTTLDSVDWKGALETEGEGGELMATWDHIARQAALLHARGGMSHGDLAARNVAKRPDNSGVFFLDWEHARISTAKPRDADARYSHSRTDMGELMESLVRQPQDTFKGGIGLLTDHPDPWRGFCHLVFDSYAATRIEAAAPKELPDVKDELTELEHSLKGHLEIVLRHIRSQQAVASEQQLASRFAKEA